MPHPLIFPAFPRMVTPPLPLPVFNHCPSEEVFPKIPPGTLGWHRVHCLVSGNGKIPGNKRWMQEHPELMEAAVPPLPCQFKPLFASQGAKAFLPQPFTIPSLLSLLFLEVSVRMGAAGGTLLGHCDTSGVPDHTWHPGAVPLCPHPAEGLPMEHRFAPPLKATPWICSAPVLGCNVRCVLFPSVETSWEGFFS